MRINTDANLCRGCEACALACSVIHEGKSNPLLSRVRVGKNMERYQFSLVICEQCLVAGETPDCMEVCPSEAIVIDERNVVIILEDLCSKCGACESACSLHAIFYNEMDSRYYKCDLCAGRDGQACVEICPVGALTLRIEALSGGLK